MKAGLYNKYGDTSVIEIDDNASIPTITDKQILVEVNYASINPVESAIRNGYMQEMLPLNFPINLGGDFSGIIKDLGGAVKDFKIGDHVYGIGNPFKGGSGSVAELVSVNAVNVSLKPDTISDREAASLPLVGASAFEGIIEHINLQKDQKILIHGGAGGIGSLAIQIAKSIGAYVATTVSEDSIELVKSLGADEAIDYKSQDFTTIISNYDAVFDTAGGENTNKSISVLREDGILVSMSGQADQELAKKQGIRVSTQMTKGDTSTLNKLSELVNTNKIEAVIDSEFSLDEAKEAYELLENGHPKGKIVIKIK